MVCATTRSTSTAEGWQASLRHVAREGGCRVVSLATALHSRDIPGDFPQRDKLFHANEAWICDGGASVYEPFGGPIAGPLHQKQKILYAEIDPARAAHARRSFDVAGHYARPDVFQLKVNRAAMPPAAFFRVSNAVWCFERTTSRRWLRRAVRGWSRAWRSA